MLEGETSKNDNLETKNLEPGDEFKAFDQVLDLKQFKQQSKFYDVARLNQ